MNKDCKKIFDELVSDAFNFLNHSISEFDNNIKYSIIHFCIAVENILKAELMCEHWSLIFKKPENANWNNFIDGSFQSVSLEDTIDRLRNISLKDIDEDAKMSFINISKERNKIIHFYNNISKESIAISQFNAWYEIDKLLQSWNQHFSKFMNEIEDIRRLMVKYQGYLKLRYNKIAPSLNALDKNKNFLATCPRCGYDTLVFSNSVPDVTGAKCAVCDHIYEGITICCPMCEKPTFVTDAHITTCRCHYSVDSDRLINFIEKSFLYYADIHHGGEVDWLANCTICGNKSAIKINEDLWFCTECFSTFDKVSCCEWCNELYTGENEDTYVFGCGVCEGIAGRYMDD